MRSRTTTGAPWLSPRPSAALFSARAISMTPKELTSARYSPGRVCAQQRKGMIAGVHQRQAEALDQRRVDVGDEIAEMIDGDDDAGDTAQLDRRVLDPGGHQRTHRFAELLQLAVARGELGRHGSEDVAAVKGGTRMVHP